MSGEFNEKGGKQGTLGLLLSAFIPLAERESFHQISDYQNDPEFIKCLPKSQREAMHAVQAHAPAELPIALEFYRNILPQTLHKMIEFKKRQKALEIGFQDSNPKPEKLDEIIHDLDKRLKDPNLKTLPADLQDLALTDDDVYDAHVIGVKFLAQKMKEQAQCDLAILEGRPYSPDTVSISSDDSGFGSLSENSDAEGIHLELAPNSLLRGSSIHYDEEKEAQVAALHKTIELANQLSEPGGPTSYYATVQLHAIVSKILPRWLVNGVMSNLAHTFNNIAKDKAVTYGERIALYEAILEKLFTNVIDFLKGPYTLSRGGGLGLELGWIGMASSAVAIGMSFVSQRLKEEAEKSYKGHPDGAQTLEGWKQAVIRLKDKTLDPVQRDERAILVAKTREKHQERAKTLMAEAKRQSPNPEPQRSRPHLDP